ncbi:MAG: heparan-alpha-glucosaminide N-acetyltransferase [Casimicrobiaceae bacterium]
MTSASRRARRTPLPAAAAPAVTLAASGRVPAIDALRGLALVAMIAYHFAFDLAYFRVAAWDFYRDPFWLVARTLILSSFLLLAGVSLVLAQRNERGRAQFWRHVATIAACALAVSIASYFVFPRSYIWFGVLHAIALSLVLIRPLAARPRIALAAGIAAIVLGNFVAFAWFDSRAWGWLGFMTAKPVTEDYVPLFPWIGVMLIGIAGGHALVRNGFRAVAPFALAPRVLAWLGRHSLAVYMLHQPLLIGLLYAVVRR